MDLSNKEIKTEEILFKDEKTLVQKVRVQNNGPFTLKTLNIPHPSNNDIDSFYNEFNILQELDSDHIRKGIAKFEYRGKPSILLEYIGGTTLKKYLNEKILSIIERTELAHKISELLRPIHHARIIHKDFHPFNILVDTNHDLKLIDFEFSTKLTLKANQLQNPNLLKGLLKYISPEQTGRMNREIDRRSDLYSLGVCLYELFTNRLPFVTDDPLDLVYHHMAISPEHPTDFNKDIPVATGDIILKLLAKDSKHRYQSIQGVISDLDECRKALSDQTLLSNFFLGKKDFSDTIQIPDKLYGREQEIESIENAYAKVSNGAFILLLVKGYSGAGKSSLVYEATKPISKNRGIFIEGKFDQYQRDYPYFAWIKAIEKLADYLLSEPPPSLERWKLSILEVLNNEGKVITNLIPGFAKIIGDQPELPDLEPGKEKTRVHRVFKNFFSSIANGKHPLFIFIDDWQWADIASIDLLEALIESEGIPFLLISGAYRENEISKEHPFSNFLLEAGGKKESLLYIDVKNLDINDVQRMISEATYRPINECSSLAKILFEKTLGNAFFLKKMLESLSEQNLLRIDLNITPPIWTWDESELLRQSAAENVVDFMIGQIGLLSEESQEFLGVASVLGNPFSKYHLSKILDLPLKTIEVRLYEAAERKFLIPAENGYLFAHDRVQQAVYTTLQLEKRTDLHYMAGKLLLKLSNSKEEEENRTPANLFEIVNHLVIGKDQISEIHEAQSLCQLCLDSGMKARLTSAFGTAIRFLRTGIELMQTWHLEHQTELQLEFNFQLGENYFSIKKLERGFEHIQHGLSLSKSNLDKVRFLDRIAYFYNWQNDFSSSLKYTLEALHLCGINIPEKENEIDITIQKEKEHFETKSNTLIETLKSKHQNSNQLFNLTLKLLANAMSAKLLGKDNIFTLFVYHAINLSLAKGKSKSLANILSLFCSILCKDQRYIEAYEVAEFSLSLIAEDPNQHRSIHTITRAALWGMPYGKHLKESIPVFSRGLRLAPLQDEKFMYANIQIDIIFHRLAMGENLDILERELQETKQVALDSKFLMFFDICEIEKTLIEHLKGSKNRASLMNRPAQEFDLYFPENSFFKGFLSHCKLQYYCWFPMEKPPKHFLKWCKEMHKAMISNIKWADFDFYAAIFLYSNKNSGSTDILEKLKEFKYNIKIRKEACIENFGHKYHLVSAFIEQLNLNSWQAVEEFKNAINLARSNGYIQVEALTNEFMGRFFVNKGLGVTGRAHIQEAIRLYLRWGATAKVDHLIEEFPDLDSSINIGNRSLHNSTTNLDKDSLIKASNLLSEEIVLTNLLQKMMPIILENAGASSAKLIDIQEEHISLLSEVDSSKLVNVCHEGKKQDFSLPLTIINYVIRNKKPVIINNKEQLAIYVRDPYFRHHSPKSILCLPILRNHKLNSILYFENEELTGAFGEHRIEALNSLSAQVGISMDNARLYEKVENAFEKQMRLTESYSRFVPKAFIDHLNYDSVLDVKLGDQVEGLMSVMFADIRSYTTLSEQMSPKDNFQFINAFLKRIGPIITDNLGFVGQYFGDGLMAIFKSEPKKAVVAAIEIQLAIHRYNQERIAKNRQPIRLGIGIQTGSLMLGILGDEQRMDTGIISDTVNTASRLEGLTKFFGVKTIIGSYTYDQISKSTQSTSSRYLGKVAVKGKIRAVDIYEIMTPEISDTDNKKIQIKDTFEKGLRCYLNQDFLTATLELKKAADQIPEDVPTQMYLKKAAHFLVEGVSSDWDGTVKMDSK